MRRRAQFASLALCSIALALYGSLVPLRFRESAAGELRWERLRALPLEPLAVTWSGDFFVNILVFLPIGFFTAAALHRPRPKHQTVVLLVLVALLMGMLALTLELSQLLVRDRTPAWFDVVGLTLGGIVGAVLWCQIGEGVTARASAGLAGGAPACSVFDALFVYSAGWFSVSLLPLLFPRYAYPLVRTVWLREPAPTTLTTTLVEWLITALAVTPVGAFLALIARRISVRPLVVSSVVILGSTAVMLLDQLRQITPLTASPHPAARVAGLAAGIFVGLRLGASGLAPLRVVGSAARVRQLLAVWCAILMLIAWAPFDFGVPQEVLDVRIRILYERVPLHRYYWAPPLVALDMTLTLVMLALPLGWLVRASLPRPYERSSMGMAVMLSVLIFGVLEWGQLYLPGRRADLTDVLIAGVGSFIGAALIHVLGGSRPRPPAGSSPESAR